MGFKFSWLVQLLEDLDAARQKRPITAARKHSPEHVAVVEWFKVYNDRIERCGPPAVALLCCLFPERLSQRSYFAKEGRLVNIISRILGLGASRQATLRKWRDGDADFPTCVEQVMAEAEMPPPPPGKEVTLEEIDRALLQIAANSPCSADEIRKNANDIPTHDILAPIFKRLDSKQGKWFTRMLLKSYSPVQVPEHTVLHSFHFLSADLLAVTNSFEAAVEILASKDLIHLEPNPAPELRAACHEHIAQFLVPKLGVMVKRQEFYKARSLQHCLQMAGRRKMSVEKKYDGEYCQVHVSVSTTPSEYKIQIFSKSGKDTTTDRIHLHAAIEASLRLGTPQCLVRANCICEGELLVWSRSRKEIRPFHVIRKHVMRHGRFLGNTADSPRARDEQLMIVFYDLLQLDHQPLIHESLDERRRHLERIVLPIEGVAELGRRTVIDLGQKEGKTELREFFEVAIMSRWEGLVLKGCSDPYIPSCQGTTAIKLKQDYIAGLGQAADLCIVGGRRDQALVDQIGVGSLSWTSFYLACIENKIEVQERRAKPSFRILDTLSHHNLSKDDIVYLNAQGQFLQIPFSASSEHLDITIDQQPLRRLPPTALFKEPFIVELMGAGFDKPSDTPYFTLRFPRVLNIKLHTDRSAVDTNSFDELQEMARQSLTVLPDSEEREDLAWIRRLLKGDIDSGTGASQVTPTTIRSAGLEMSSFPSPHNGRVRASSSNPSVFAGRRDSFRREHSGSPPGEQQQTRGNFKTSPEAVTAESRRSSLKRRCETSASTSPVKTKRTKSNPCPESRSDALKPAMGSRSSSKMLMPAFREQHYSLREPFRGAPPFEPPAVFRDAVPPTASNVSPDPGAHHRRPLSEITNASPRRLLQETMLATDLVKGASQKNPGSSVELESALITEDQSCPRPLLSLEAFANHVFAPDWAASSVETCTQEPPKIRMLPALPAYMPTLIHLIDYSSAVSAAMEIKTVGQQVLKTCAMLPSRCDAGCQPGHCALLRRQSLVIFCDRQIERLPTPLRCLTSGIGSEHRQYVLGALVFTTRRPLCHALGALHSQACRSEEPGPEACRRATGRVSRSHGAITVDAVFNWNQIWALLPRGDDASVPFWHV